MVTRKDLVSTLDKTSLCAKVYEGKLGTVHYSIGDTSIVLTKLSVLISNTKVLGNTTRIDYSDVRNAYAFSGERVFGETKYLYKGIMFLIGEGTRIDVCHSLTEIA